MKNFDFVRIAIASPVVNLANPKENEKEITRLYMEASNNNVDILCFPELSITGSTCGDLFYQKELQNAIHEVLTGCVNSLKKDTILIIGLPIVKDNKLYDCAAVIYKGEILGIVPKATISKARPQFTAYTEENTVFKHSQIFNSIPFGNKQLFKLGDFSFGIELGEDLYSVPSTAEQLRLNGADVVFNLSSMCDYIGAENKWQNILKAQSDKLNIGYVFANANIGESSTDFVFTGQQYVFEDGKMLACKQENGLSIVDIDFGLLKSKQLKNPYINQVNDYNKIIIDSNPFINDNLLHSYPKTPFVPTDPTELFNIYQKVLKLQAMGLAQRLRFTKSKNVVLGLSGGLDSTWALIVCIETMKLLGKDFSCIHAVSMPGAGTSDRTRKNAKKLAKAFKVEFEEISITDSVNLHFKNIGHDPDNHNATYENAQARERTQILMDIAGDLSGFVVGTGDLSETALGWCTYNGDHMSMYNVNADVPKTLIKCLCILKAKDLINEAPHTASVIFDILNTPISPELLPEVNGQMQETEKLVGPYVLNDFFLYYGIHCGFSPEKVQFLAYHVFKDEYTLEELNASLKKFYGRFFSQQFKRSCVPDGPKVGSVSLSPRGAWNMPSDASSTQWTTF